MQENLDDFTMWKRFFKHTQTMKEYKEKNINYPK